MNRRFLAAGFIFAMLMVSVSGCLTGDGEEKDENSIPDDIKHLNAGANGMSSTRIYFTNFMDSTHMSVVVNLDKTRSAEEHVVYLFLFEGAEPATSSVGLDEIRAALEEEAVESFEMTWENDRVTWEVDIAPSSVDHFSFVMWNPDRDEYGAPTPNAYVDVEIFFSEAEGGGDGGDENDRNAFREYDVTDWTEYNEDAGPLSVLEMCDLLTSHMDEISAGGKITAFTSGGFTGTDISKTTGKCPGWQVYIQRTDDNTTYSKIINIAENGWCIVMDDHQVMGYPVWDPNDARVDTPAIMKTAGSNETLSNWIVEHPNYRFTIQSYHGPPLDSDEESYLLMYKSGDDELDVFISAVDGRIMDVKDPNDWSSWID